MARINNVTKSPSASWTKTEKGHSANIGNYHLSFAYGGVSLHQMLSNGGGVRDVFRSGHITKRELANQMWAFIEGLETATAKQNLPVS